MRFQFFHIFYVFSFLKSLFFIIAIRMMWSSLIWISLMTENIECNFMCLFVIFIFRWREVIQIFSLFRCVTTIGIIDFWEFFKYFLYYQIEYKIEGFLSQGPVFLFSLSKSCFLKRKVLEFYWSPSYNFFWYCIQKMFT